MKIVFHDVDGCLNADANTPIPINGEQLPPHQSAKLRELGRKLDASSIDHLVINTGRSIENTVFLAEAIASHKLQYAIGEHGAVYHDVKNDKPITPQGSITSKLDLIRNLIDWYRKTGAKILNKRIGADVPVLDKVANLTLDARNGLDSQQIYDELQTVIKNEAPFDYKQLVFHHSKSDGYVDVMSQIDKGDGITIISSLLSRKDDSTNTVNNIAIGNGLNDMPMLEAASLPLCPANAEPEVQDYCRSNSGIVSKYGFIDATLHWLDEQT